MRAPRHGPPRYLATVLRRVFQGARGAEICEELEQEYTIVRERHTGLVAWFWYLRQLFRPSTWKLASALRRGRTPKRGEASLVSLPRRSWAVISLLDVKLGLRMLAKHPGLSLVGGFGMAVAIAMGALVGAVAAAAYASLPFDEGSRVVAIEVWDQAVNNQERRILHDYETWREELESGRGPRRVYPAQPQPRLSGRQGRVRTSDPDECLRIPAFAGPGNVGASPSRGGRA